MSHYNSVCCLCGLSLSYITAGLSSAVCLCITFFSAYPGRPHPQPWRSGGHEVPFVLPASIPALPPNAKCSQQQAVLGCGQCHPQCHPAVPPLNATLQCHLQCHTVMIPAMPPGSATLQCHLAMPTAAPHSDDTCSAILQCHLQCHSAVPHHNATPQCHSAMPYCNAILECHSAMPPCSATLQCHTAMPHHSATPQCLLQCHSALPPHNATPQCHSTMPLAIPPYSAICNATPRCHQTECYTRAVGVPSPPLHVWVNMRKKRRKKKSLSSICNAKAAALLLWNHALYSAQVYTSELCKSVMENILPLILGSVKP